MIRLKLIMMPELTGIFSGTQDRITMYHFRLLNHFYRKIQIWQKTEIQTFQFLKAPLQGGALLLLFYYCIS